MKFLLPRVALTSITLGVCASGYAQEPVPIEFYRPLKNSVSIGVRMIGGNAKVGFSNLGNFPAPTGSSTSGIYDNGGWTTDAKRRDGGYYGDTGTGMVADTNPSDGTDIKTKLWYERVDLGADRYQIIAHTIHTDPSHTTAAPKNYTIEQIAGEYVNYDPAQHTGSTRFWSYNSTSQVGGTDGAAYVDLSNYSTTASGRAQAESDQSTGVELQFSRIIKRYKRFEWGLNFSAGAATINAKNRSQVVARLNKQTDRYFLESVDSNNDQVGPSDFPFAWYGSNQDTTVSGTLQTIVTGTATATDYTYNIENYRYLNYANPTSLGTTDAGAINVNGYWQIKGAYYMLRVGPMVRFPIAKNWTVSVSAGAAGAYVGTRFVVDEYISLDDVAGNPIRFQTAFLKQNTTEEKRFIPGYYGDINIERWLTVRTGVYVGYGYEKLGDYSQEIGGRKADIDLGTSSGFRFGIITRF